MDGWWNLIARAIAVDPSRRLRSCCLELECDLLIVSWVASVWWVMMEGILIVGYPLAGLAALPLAMWRGRSLRCGKVGCRSRCDEDVVCAVDVFVCAIGDGRWRLVRRFGTGLGAWGALVTRFPSESRTISINARSRILVASGITDETLHVNRY